MSCHPTGSLGRCAQSRSWSCRGRPRGLGVSRRPAGVSVAPAGRRPPGSGPEGQPNLECSVPKRDLELLPACLPACLSSHHLMHAPTPRPPAWAMDPWPGIPWTGRTRSSDHPVARQPSPARPLLPASRSPLCARPHLPTRGDVGGTNPIPSPLQPTCHNIVSAAHRGELDASRRNGRYGGDARMDNMAEARCFVLAYARVDPWQVSRKPSENGGGEVPRSCCKWVFSEGS